jgi:CRAL/TRIO domain
MLWSTVQTFLEAHTKKKISIHRHGTCAELTRLIAPNQLQEKFGGLCPNASEQAWPPRMPLMDEDSYDKTKVIDEN